TATAEVALLELVDRWRCRVVGVADVVAPGDDVAVLVGLLHCDVGHDAGWGGAVPVVLAGLEEDAVAGSDHFDRAAFALAEADAFGDPDRLAVWVGVPGGAGAGCELDGGGADPPV